MAGLVLRARHTNKEVGGGGAVGSTFNFFGARSSSMRAVAASNSACLVLRRVRSSPLSVRSSPFSFRSSPFSFRSFPFSFRSFPVSFLRREWVRWLS